MRLSNISKAYGGITVFDNFSAELPNGKITRITGSSGCGKTTLLRIISGLEPFSGDISNRPEGKISGGMKRRAAIVRALCPDFGTLLLDEPFKGIDRDNAVKTAELIREMAAGKTIIIVSHEADCPLVSDITISL